jgi:hypothetical protein
MSVTNKITLLHLKNIFINLFQKNKPIPLGRWNIHKDNKQKLVVNYSNEDHCGTCAQYIQIKKKKSIPEKKPILEKEKIYGYEYILLSSNTQD